MKKSSIYLIRRLLSHCNHRPLYTEWEEEGKVLSHVTFLEMLPFVSPILDEGWLKMGQYPSILAIIEPHYS